MRVTRLLVPTLIAACAGTLASTPAAADPRDEVIAAFQQAMNAKSYRMQIEIDNKRGPISTQMDVQMPNRFHMKAAEAEFIIVPEGTWINAAGRWMKVPVDMSKQMQGYRIEDMQEAASQLPAVEEIGSDTVNGCASTLYRYTSNTSFAGRSSEDDIEVAVCESSGKPIRLRSTPKRRGEAVTIHYDFEAAVNIRAPQ